MKISKKTFGMLASGRKVHLYTLKAGDLQLTVTDFGAHLVSLFVPSRRRPREDVLLGYATLEGYTTRNIPYMGATVGRFANRIAGGSFSLNGNVYNLYKNNGENTLHGGRRGFDKLPWKAESYEEKDGIYVRFELESPDGNEGFPGNLKAVVSYGLTKSNELIADYHAKVDTLCPVNLTNHAYFNLAGEGNGDILSHEVTLHASRYIGVNSKLIPTGDLLPVQGGPFDFTAAKPVSRDIEAAGGGYDHCFAVDGEEGTLRPCAEVHDPKSGRTMKLLCTNPGVQFYTGNFLDDVAGKPGSVYGRHAGFCLETQYFPDSPNQPEFPSCIFGPSRNFHEKSLFSFEW
ncbi:aldose epimerase family protein [Breznakiella homolactica]|uniref:Aldose 1-epimerase n=1 Tax=Breznakiella homolactica TaxID=2798577 RepID=A0A7T8B9D9_9SPIR|nr:aldose epimerase family protein [Breznakiella homolactica]QQO08226.1 galactose mutarotase [Breznakiella homolactica]